MKKLLIFALIIAAFASCKRKQTLRELGSDQTLAEYPVTCYNATLDGDETSVDCGGSCGPCNFATPSCTYTSKTIKIGLSSYTSTGTACGLVGSNYQFSGNYGNGTYTINLGTTSPEPSKVYAITNSVPNSTQATIYFSDFSYGNVSFLAQGNVYVGSVGGKYIATICGAAAYSFITSTTYTISGNVSCP